MIRFEIPDKSFIAFHQYPISMVGREILKEFLRMLSHLQKFFKWKNQKRNAVNNGAFVSLF
jgi:hypothetical protein